MRPGQICRVGGRFSRCQNDARYSCQYCGREFCEAHAHHVEGIDAVCSRKRCRAKHADMAEHDAYRERVAERNHVGLCGVEECGPHPAFECSLCRGLFCANHLSERMYPFSDGWVSIDRPVSLCAHCWERRKIWRGR